MRDTNKGPNIMIMSIKLIMEELNKGLLIHMDNNRNFNLKMKTRREESIKELRYKKVMFIIIINSRKIRTNTSSGKNNSTRMLKKVITSRHQLRLFLSPVKYQLLNLIPIQTLLKGQYTQH